MTTIPEDKLEGIISKGKELEKQLGQENTSEKFVELSTSMGFSINNLVRSIQQPDKYHYTRIISDQDSCQN